MGDICILPADLADVGSTAGDVELRPVDARGMDHGTWSPDGRLLACNLLKRHDFMGCSFLGTALVSFAPRSKGFCMLELEPCNWEAAAPCAMHTSSPRHTCLCVAILQYSERGTLVTTVQTAQTDKASDAHACIGSARAAPGWPCSAHGNISKSPT